MNKGICYNCKSPINGYKCGMLTADWNTIQYYCKYCFYYIYVKPLKYKMQG